jgi:hypothetical protein
MWLYILNIYSSKTCVKNLTIYFYFTSLEKRLPQSNIVVLDEINVNTAFTYSCPKNSEIVVFRKEEWFKVFIHETFHNFGLDFSNMKINESTQHILKIFPVNSYVNLYEAYSEFWAEIINALFCSFLNLENKNNLNQFLKYSEFFINFERTYSFFQLVKVLNFMGLTYKDLYLKNPKSELLRKTMYKEKSNILSYYVIKTILLNSYQDFLKWCSINNSSLLQFKKTIVNQKLFCLFIEKKYKIKSIITSIEKTENFFMKIKNKKNDNLFYDNLLHNMRMSICEIE